MSGREPWFPSHLLGKPDGFFVRLRCRVLRHDWEGCYDECCDGRLCWCRRCLMNDAHLRAASSQEPPLRQPVSTGAGGDLSAEQPRELFAGVPRVPMCRVVTQSSWHNPVRCAYAEGHPGDHSWASLPALDPLAHNHTPVEGCPACRAAHSQEPTFTAELAPPPRDPGFVTHGGWLPWWRRDDR